MKLSIHLLGHSIKINPPPEVLVGINSNTKKQDANNWDEEHILMIDYDDKLSLTNLETETRRLQEKYSLGDATIYESSYHHYNIIYHQDCLNYFTCLRIIHDTPCDPEYKKWRMIRQQMTLRMNEKEGNKIKKVITITSTSPRSIIKEYNDKCEQFKINFEKGIGENK